VQTCERNKGRAEARTLQTQAVTPEQVCFPAAAQAAVLQRHAGTRQPEIVHLLTSAGPERLTAARWLQFNRAAWGIENGLHQRLDVTAQEDRSRVRHRHAVRLLGLFRRLGISLFMHWRDHNPKRAQATLRDFHDAMSLDHQRHAFLFVSAARPSTSAPS
jgi:hypothetical protein